MNWSDLDIATIILDRDGVINVETGNFVKSVDEWRPIAGSLDAIARLTKAGYPVFVATNQSGIRRGLYSVKTLELIHQKMIECVRRAGGEIKAVYYCPHTDSDHCDCRKPKSGMLKQIAADHDVDLDRSLMVGDSIRDLKSALNTGAYAVLVGASNGLKRSLSVELADTAKKVMIYSSLAGFVEAFLSDRVSMAPS